MQTNLKLITRYDAGRNEYTVYRHNLIPENVDEAVREVAARLFGLFVVDQKGTHSAEDPGECQACRREVERKSHVHPKPTPKRRHE